MSTKPSKELEVVPNPHPDRDYEVRIECPEFTALCPKTGQPDFAVIYFRYIPGPWIVELKSLKLYLWSFRDEGHFHEDVTNRILKDFVTAAQPRWLEVIGEFNVRGNLHHREGSLPGSRVDAGSLCRPEPGCSGLAPAAQWLKQQGGVEQKDREGLNLAVF